MTNLTWYNSSFSWGPEEQGAFDVLKVRRQPQAPVLFLRRKNVCADMMSRAPPPPPGSWSNDELNSSEIDVIDSDDILDFTSDNEDGSGDAHTPADDPVSLLKDSGIQDLQRNDGQYSLIIERLEKGLQHDSFVLDKGNFVLFVFTCSQ